ncbi:MAG: primosomal protein N' (replication factor Y) - superfamily II helicase [Planctomycetota bacterium]|jgi:DNA-directed RNA polymerase subunit RPC12/RpoP|nr:primosomal protein N' (replication factor Y) - superfamily II helicase [Planctomycetota bacterium]
MTAEDGNPKPDGRGESGGVRQFPCSHCGGSLTFQPGTAHLKCPYCGTENDIPLDAGDDGYLKENDFLAALETEEKSAAEAAPVAEAARCGACGAVTTVAGERSADRCPYCGSPLSVQNRQSFRLNVQALLPFVVNAEKALQSYREWIASRWFAPNDFRRRATRSEAMNGIYMPYWTYDAQTSTNYAGQRGDAYYETVMVTVERNGRRSLEPRQLRKIRWRRAAGTVAVPFDDVLVPASRSLPEDLQDSLEPWGLDNLKPFREEFLSGFVTETYRIGLKDGFADAKSRMRPAIEEAVRRDIGGDEQRIDSMDTRYSGVTFKHILLPVWLSAYSYGGTAYRFMINAQTGEAAGNRPWSFWKIALAVVSGLAAAGALLYYM